MLLPAEPESVEVGVGNKRKRQLEYIRDTRTKLKNGYVICGIIIT